MLVHHPVGAAAADPQRSPRSLSRCRSGRAAPPGTSPGSGGGHLLRSSAGTPRSRARRPAPIRQHGVVEHRRVGMQRQQLAREQRELTNVERPVVRAEALDEDRIRDVEAERAAHPWPSTIARNNEGIPSTRCRSGGIATVRPSSRASRSPRKRLSATACRSGLWVAASSRTSMATGVDSPSGQSSRCSTARSSLAWIGNDSSAISSRNSVPPSAAAQVAERWRARRR